MGQSYSLTTPYAGSAGIDVPELSDLIHERTYGDARFMKTIRARGYDGLVLAKVTVKPHTPLSLKSYGDKILQERDKLRDVPNALGFERAFETDTNAYLLRQFIYNSVYDRFSTRPFLEDIEKRWIAFQLLCALRDCHARDIYHGDIKTENILVTSWNWVYLTDFTASFKPTRLPDNNPALYSYFFDMSGRRTCYIAPERFLAPGEEASEDDKITWAMDIFSAGCAIAELFLETPIFSLSQLYKFRRGEFDPVISHLSRIPDQGLREMLSSMLALDPQKRYSAEQYLDIFRGKVFPEYFYTFLHQYLELLTDPSSGRAPVSGASKNLGEADERIDRIFYDFDKISYFLGYQEREESQAPSQFTPRLGLGLFPTRLNIPNNEHFASVAAQPVADDGTLIFLSMIAASIRNTARAASKIRACDVMLAFSERLTDEAKLDRVLPYLMLLLNDDADTVAIAALRSVTQLLAMVTVVTPVNAHVFPEYIMPRMQVFLAGASRQLVMGKERREPTALVRATYASCLGSLATTASKFLEMAAILRAEGSIATADPEVEAGSDAEAAFDSMFDNAQRELIELFETHAKVLVEDADASVRRAFLSSVPELCMFFGSAESNDILLTHLNTYLNDRDWMLKCAFFDTVVGIAAFLGSTSLEEFNLPLMVQALTDPEEHVVQAALHSLAELSSLGLLSKAKIWELVDVVGRFTVHPNVWIRESAVEYLAKSTKFLSPASIRCIVLPQIQPFLKEGIIPDFTELGLLEALKKPLSRTVFDQAMVWAQKAEKGLFWKAVQKQRQSTFTIGSLGMARPLREPQTLLMSKVPRNEEDEQWLSRLRSYGMTHEDEFKLLALREFIFRLSRMRNRDWTSSESATKGLDDIIIMRSIPDAKVQTIMFDDSVSPEATAGHNGAHGDADKGPYTITDALLDASMTIDEPVGRRRRAAINTHRSKLSGQHGGISPRSLLSPTQTQPSSPIDGHGTFDDTRSPSATRGRAAARGDEPSSSERPYSARRAVRHQASALDLLRKDSNRSIAETSTTETNAFGQVEGPFAQNATPRISLPGSGADSVGLENLQNKQYNSNKTRASHTYEGNDPNILKMLDGIYVDNYPHDIVEFGPLVVPASRRTGKTQAGQDAWRPNGRLVATFAEHIGAINRVVTSPDHLFFITGGDDGTVKVWDSSRLERNVSHRARQTHKHASGAKVIALCFIENTHCFISCATDGSVHIVKVDITQTSGGPPKYVRLRLLREYQLPADEYAVWCTHFKLELPSVLLLATNRSRILGIDLRTMTLLYALENPVHHGTPTCFVVDRKRHWLLLGTTHGVLDLWDLRFKLRLKGWGMPGKSPIYRLALHPSRGRGKWVCIAGGTGLTEVTVWDIEKVQCREIYRAASTTKEGPREYKSWDADEDKPEGMLGRFATDIEPSAASATDRCVRAMMVGSNAPDDQSRDVRYGFMITGSADKKLRFWDLNRIDQSTVFSGLVGDDAKPVFTPYTSPNNPNLTLNLERIPKSSSAAAGEQKGSSRNTDAVAAKKREKPPRHTVISAEQAQLLRSHLDNILDVTVLEVPYTMTVSVDRSGVIFVFQ
ncbi:phosphoinositide 3-kinase regulatory subunit 4 [Xylariales sp. PMI_506]|nr:phosphoinositide 3-kinase regulatory subunit 4 [Xylariales sp. PMI_506]